jgi:hypothetical protein
VPEEPVEPEEAELEPQTAEVEGVEETPAEAEEPAEVGAKK